MCEGKLKIGGRIGGQNLPSVPEALYSTEKKLVSGNDSERLVLSEMVLTAERIWNSAKFRLENA